MEGCDETKLITGDCQGLQWGEAGTGMGDWYHGEEGHVAPNLDASHIDLDHGTLAVCVVQRDGLVRRGGHEGPLDAALPRRGALRGPELLREQHLP